jgi:pimeloyl-ACP methyl ester carboxylesterase
MIADVRTQVLSAVPGDRLAGYREHRGLPVRDEDVTAMAQAQARLLVAGPDRDPADVDPAVWQLAITMLELVFRRDWTGPGSAAKHPDPPAAARLSAVRTPTLVVNGLADARWIQDVSDLLSAGIPGAQRLDLPDTGHLPPLERPTEVTAALRRFLAATSQAG